MTNLDDFRLRIGKFILYANLGIFVLVFVLFAARGFTSEELQEVLKFLIPIKSTYMAAMVKFVLANRKAPERGPNAKAIELSPLYRSMTLIIIYGHIFVLTLVIVLCAFNAISFITLTYFIIIVETFFGAYVGIIITDIFKDKSPSEEG